MTETARLFGCDLACLTMEQTVEEVRRIVMARSPRQHVVLNAAKVVLMANDADLAAIVRGCSLVSADGQSVVWAARLAGYRVPERVAGVDLMNRLLQEAELADWSVFFLGASKKALAEFQEVVAGRHLRLRVAGGRHGYFSEAEESAVVCEITNASPDLLFVGISSPKKEYFLARNLHRMGVPFAMGVGGAFDVEAGLVKRAPSWMQVAGLEWLHRLLQEPGRMWRRYLLGNARFVLIALGEIWRARLGRGAETNAGR